MASLLAIPDAIAIIPGCTNFLNWAISLLGIWLTAVILWYVGFLFILHAFRLLSGPVVISDTGLKLSNLDREIPWSRIRGVCVETQPLFARIFSLKPVARKLIIYTAPKPDGRFTHRDLPSFFFSEEDFDNFSKELLTRIIDQPVTSAWLYASADKDFQKLKRVTRLVAVSRFFLSLLIAFGVTTFLGRKALVNYLYNAANRDLANGNIQLAADSYKQVLFWEPGFPSAWHNLAIAEFQSHNYEEAKRCWDRALLLKPDYVEPKVSLAFLHLKKREFLQAKKLLERARRNNPGDRITHINMAELYFQIGNSRKAMRTARFVLAQDPSSIPAYCLLIRSKIQSGNMNDAELELKRLAANSPESALSPLFQITKGELYLYRHEPEKAKAIFASILKQTPDNNEALLNMARCLILEKQFDEADKFVKIATKVNEYDPRAWLLEAQLKQQLGDIKSARAALEQALSFKNQDLGSLKESTRLMKELKLPQLRFKIAELYRGFSAYQ